MTSAAWQANNVGSATKTGYLADSVVLGRHIVAFFLLGLCVYCLAGVRDSWGPLFLGARAFLGGLLLLSLVIPTRVGIPLFFLLLLVCPDLMQGSSEKSLMGEYRTASVWQFFLGPIRAGWIIGLATIVQALRTMSLPLNKRVTRAILWFLTVPVFAGFIYGGFSSFAWQIEVTADLKTPIQWICSIILFHGFFRRHPHLLGMMLALFLGASVAKFLGDFCFWLLELSGPAMGSSSVSADSAKSSIVLLLLLAIYMLMTARRVFLGCALGLACGVLIVLFGTRLIWITSLLCTSVLMLLYGAKRATILVPFAVALGLGSVGVLRAVYPDAFERLMPATESFSDEQSGSNILMRVDALRYGEMLNSLDTSMKRWALLWGNGYGSYYNDDVMAFPTQLTDAHPDYSAKSGHFFYCHNYVSQILFKYGLIGLIVITGLWVGPAFECYKVVFNPKHPHFTHGFVGSCIAFIPNAVLIFYWPAKGLFLGGFILAVFLSVNERHREETAAIAPDS